MRPKYIFIIFILINSFLLLNCGNDSAEPIIEKGKINLNVDTIKFRTFQNDTLPTTFNVVITTLPDPLDWSIIKDQDWLSVSPILGKGVASIKVSVNTSNLDSGSYWAKINIISKDASNSPGVIYVNYIINLKPVYYWEKINTPDFNQRINCFYKTTHGYIYSGTDGFGINRSTDDGNTWQTFGISGQNVFSIIINTNGHIIATTNTSGVFRSTDNGTSWTAINNGIIKWSSIYEPFKAVIIAKGGSILLGSNYMYISTNNGEEWKIKSTAPTNITAFIMNSEGEIYASSRGSSYPFVVGISQSVDNGVTWQRLNFGYAPVSFAINSLGHIFVITAANGIFRSIDNGATWNYLALTGKELHSIIIDQKDKIFIGSLGTMYCSKDNGATWSGFSLGLDNSPISAMTINSKGFIIAGTFNSGIYRSLKTANEF